MTVRKRLPDRRASVSFNFACGPHHYIATISYFPGSNRLAEIFPGNGRAGSDIDAAAKDSAVVASIALATVPQFDRVLAENGLRSSGGRGTSAARVTPRDVANLLLAIMGSPMSGAAIKEAARTCRVYGSLPNLERAAMRENLLAYGLGSLARLPKKHTLHQALVSLIEGARLEQFMDHPITGADYSGADHLFMIRLDSPRPWAEIFADSGAGDDPRKWARLVYTKAFEKKKDDLRPELYDLTQTRRVTYKTIRLIAATLHKAE
jgi:hypothetical protein